MDVQRVPTGVEGLDSLLQGGFFKGRSYLVTGDAGTGKTTACLQFLWRGLTEGEKAVYVTVDERPAEILHSAASLGWDIQSYVDEKRLIILDASPYFSGRTAMATGKGVDLEKIVSDLSAYAKRMEATRLAVDPVTPLILPSDATTRVQDLARSFVYLIQSQLTTTNLFTAHLPATAAQNQTSGIEEFLASGVFTLRMYPVNGHFMRSLTIKKMRGTPVAPAECPFLIMHDKGIVFDAHSHDTAADADGEAAVQTLEFFELPNREK